MNLEELLQFEGIVHSKYPNNGSEFINELKKRSHTNKPVKLLYGETFDEGGHPIESLKYYLFVDELSNALSKEGIPNEAVILIADLGVKRNAKTQEEIDNLTYFAEKRYNFVKNIKEKYNCNFEIKYLTEIAESEKFKTTFNTLQKKILPSNTLRRLIEKTVPSDKVAQSRENNYIYSLEELSAISDVDIKIGPPRERLYDSLLREISRELGSHELFSVYLTQTYPLGLKFSDYMSSPAINKYGLTPYKAGSKGFVENRVLLDETSDEQLESLIDNSQISSSKKKPNPVLDLTMIGELVKYHSGEEPSSVYADFYQNKIKPSMLKNETFNVIKTYVLDVLR